MADLTPQVPQFGKAEYLGQPGSNRCAYCSQDILHQYYRIGSAMACPACASTAQLSAARDTHATFVRALLFGAGGALLGLVVYAGVEMATGWIIGYVALAVGFIVAKAMLMGSGGIGGRRYQIAAALLTYAAVSIAAVPVALHQKSESAPQHRSVRSPATTSPDANSPDVKPDVNPEVRPEVKPDDSASVTSAEAMPEKPRMSFFAALGSLLMLGLASPFLDLADPIHGAIGLVILFVGIRIAWQMMVSRSPQIFGPFDPTSAS